MKRTATLLPVLLLAGACGSSEPATGATTPAAEPPAAHQEKEHPELTPELAAFHERLSPLWHADKGEQRRKDTCAAVPDFKTRAAAVKAAAPPAGADAAAWTSAGAELETSVGGLESACAGSDPAGFETAFEAVHTRFHHAMELVAGPEKHGHEKGEAEADHGGW